MGQDHLWLDGARAGLQGRFWSLSDAMVRDPRPWIGDYVLPNMDPGNAYQIIATMAYTKVKYLIEQTVASGLIYLNSHASDFKNGEIRPYTLSH
jgi:4-hydroxyphenylacetate 3-monooxygenase